MRWDEYFRKRSNEKTNRPRDKAVGLFFCTLLKSKNREGRLKGWRVLFCFKYGEKQDGRKDIDGFRRPLHGRDSLLCHPLILSGGAVRDWKLG